MSRTSMGIRFTAWVLPLLTAYSLGQAPPNRTGANLMRPVARGGAQTGPPSLASTPAPSNAAPVPLTMAQLPAVPPEVTYQNGMLTIVAQNSSLGDVLREVHRITGAAIDVPPNATERVIAQIGPGPAREVLASLLNGSAFNYVMVGSSSDPTRLASVMLTTKPAGPPPESAANVYQPAQQQYIVNQPVMAPGQGPGGPVVQPAAGDDEADADAEEDKDEDDSGDDDQDQNQAGNTNPNAQDGSQPNAGPKTPQQILEMLRQRQQQGPGQPVIPPPQPRIVGR